MEAESHDLDAEAATEVPAETEADGGVDVGVHLHAAGVARKVHGERDDTRTLIDVLLLHRHLTADAVALERPAKPPMQGTSARRYGPRDGFRTAVGNRHVPV